MTLAVILLFSATWAIKTILFVARYPGVNVTNILRAAFSYESFLRSFYVLTIWFCNFLMKGFWHKSCS
jgi:hypothetical protein